MYFSHVHVQHGTHVALHMGMTDRNACASTQATVAMQPVQRQLHQQGDADGAC